jgi:hypothetical protein
MEAFGKMTRSIATVMLALLLTVFTASAAFAHGFNPPNGGLGDTPLNSEKAQEKALDHYLAALSHSQAENSLLRNPTCALHDTSDGIHPPGNP